MLSGEGRGRVEDGEQRERTLGKEKEGEWKTEKWNQNGTTFAEGQKLKT